MWETAKEWGAKAASATSLAAKQTKLRAEIMFKQNYILELKKQMGLAIYTHLLSGDDTEQKACFYKYKALIDAEQREINAKERAISASGERPGGEVEDF